MYNNLIEEDIMILDNEFFKIDTMFESVDKMYDIKQRELEYNYIYTESINEEFVDLYTEAEEAKSKNEQGLLGRLFTAILNFIRKIRAKILRLFGNDKKAAELEAKIKGNPKLANQTVEITNTTDAEKAIDEGTSFFGSLIDKIVKGTATEADADAAEEKNKSLLSRIGIFGGGALLAAGGAKVANDKLHITEKLGNLLKREEDTKKKSIEVTQTNEQNVQKGDQALKNNSQSGNEENTKAGRRIMGSFKDFITDAGKFFTGKASELKSRFSSSSDKVEKQPETSTTDTTEQKNGKNDKTKDEQQTSTPQARPKIVNYPEFSDATDNDKEKLIMDASKVIKTIPQNSEKGKREKENLEKIISKGVSINSGDYNTLVNVVRNGDISKKYKESNNKKNEQPKNKTDIQMDDEEASIRCKHIIEEIKIYDSTNHVLTKDEVQKINEIDKKVTNKKCNENDLNMVQKINDDMKKRTPDTSRNSNIFNHTNEAETEEPNSYCNRTIKEIETEPGEGAKLTDDEKKQIDEIKDRLKNKKCTRNDAKILDRISDEQDKRRRALLKNDKTKPEDKAEKQPETSTTDTTEQKNGKNDKTKDEQQTSTSQARHKGVSSNNSDDDKKKRTPEPNSYCDERIKKIEFYLDRGYKLTEEEQKQINEIKDRLKNKKCTENDVKILGKISAKKPPEVEMDEEIEKLMFKFHDYVYSHERPDVLSLNIPLIKKGHSIVSLEDLSKIKFPTNYDNKESDSVVEKAKIFLDSYKIYSKYKNPDKNKVKEALKNIYDDDYSNDSLDEEMKSIKITFTTLDKYAKELNELIKKRETFKESSYDLINDILTIFENSF